MCQDLIGSLWFTGKADVFCPPRLTGFMSQGRGSGRRGEVWELVNCTQRAPTHLGEQECRQPVLEPPPMLACDSVCFSASYVSCKPNI
jgi:hypothetical protein